MQVFVGGGNAIFLLLTVLFTAFLALVALLARKWKNESVFRTAAGVGVVVIGVYGALLITAALASKERVLGPGEIKWFCGFYLDCHLGVSIAKVESVKSLAHSNDPVVAKGVFKIVTVELHNSAKNSTVAMTLYHPLAVVVDARSVRYARSLEAERAIAQNRSFAVPLKEKLSITHTPSFATLVFDVPPDAPNPKLSIDEGFIVDRIIELVLVNDDNSVFHEPTFLALGESKAVPPASYLRIGSHYIPRVRLASR